MGTTEIKFPCEKPAKILKWKVSAGTMVAPGKVLLLYKTLTTDKDEKTSPEEKLRTKSERGRVTKILVKQNEIIQPGQRILLLEGCTHPTVMKDLCAECGVDLREGGQGRDSVLISQASVPMVHSIPELKVCPELAIQIGKEDEKRLLRDKKLALLVDLDQTIVHTTNDDIQPHIKDVYHYKLPGHRSQWYHTRLRPNTRHFLSEMSRLYELHICTFGVREYAHTVAALLDKDGELFSHRILSRDECFDPGSKYPNLKALFPCGDDMVCIIDDREDVWQGCGNLVQVKPYYFFRHTANIHAPPGMNKLDDPSEPCSSGTNELAEAGSEDDKNGVLEEINQELELTIPKSTKESENFVNTEVKEVQATDEQNCNDSEATETKNESINNKEDNEIANKKVENEDADSKADKDEDKSIGKLKIKSKNDSRSKVKNEGNNLEIAKDTQEEAKREDEAEHEDQDDYLLYLEDILRRIHKEYYNDLEKETGRRSLRDIIPKVRATVLKGFKLTFSGIIPTHQKLHQSRAYKVARAFGANVAQDLTNDTTHLVAMKPGTQKVNTAKKRGNIKIVNPDWLWTCAERWEHVDERLYTLTSEVRASRIPPPHCTNPEPMQEVPVTGKDNFANTINPLFFVSKEQIYDMDKEVEEDMTDAEMDPSVYDFDEQMDDIYKEVEEDISNSSIRDFDNQIKVTELGIKREHEGTDFMQHEIDEFRMSSAKRRKEEESIEFQRIESLPDNIDLGDNSQDSVELDTADVEDDREWNAMGAALEREFLSD